MIFAYTVAGLCFSMSFWKYSYIFMQYRKGTSDWNGFIFQLTEVLSTNKFWAHASVGTGGQRRLFLQKKFVLDAINVCPSRVNLNNLPFSFNISETSYSSGRFSISNRNCCRLTLLKIWHILHLILSPHVFR